MVKFLMSIIYFFMPSAKAAKKKKEEYTRMEFLLSKHRRHIDNIERGVDHHLYYNLSQSEKSGLGELRRMTDDQVSDKMTLIIDLIAFSSGKYKEEMKLIELEYDRRQRMSPDFIDGLFRMSDMALYLYAKDMQTKPNKLYELQYYLYVMALRGTNSPYLKAKADNVPFVKGQVPEGAGIDYALYWLLIGPDLSGAYDPGQPFPVFGLTNAMHVAGGGTFDGAGASGDWIDNEAGKPVDFSQIAKTPEAFPILSSTTEVPEEMGFDKDHPLNWGDMSKTDLPEGLSLTRNPHNFVTPPAVWEKPEVSTWEKPATTLFHEPTRSNSYPESTANVVDHGKDSTPSYTSPEPSYSPPGGDCGGSSDSGSSCSSD
jgi:hypothetical protein